MGLARKPHSRRRRIRKVGHDESKPIEFVRLVSCRRSVRLLTQNPLSLYPYRNGRSPAGLGPGAQPGFFWGFSLLVQSRVDSIDSSLSRGAKHDEPDLSLIQSNSSVVNASKATPQPSGCWWRAWPSPKSEPKFLHWKDLGLSCPS